MSATQKLILLAMADHADDQGANAFPSVARLAEKCSVDPRTVQRTLRALEEAGLLVVIRAATQHYPTTYKVTPGAAQCRGGNPPGRQSVPPGVTSDPSRGGTVPPESSLTIKNRPSFVGAGEETFAVFWRDYPRKTDKQEAFGLWQKLALDQVPILMTGLQRWKRSDEWARGFAPSPARWLRRRKWEDEPPAPAVRGPDPSRRNSLAPVEARQNIPPPQPRDPEYERHYREAEKRRRLAAGGGA